MCVCVSVFDACHPLTNSLEEGNSFIQCNGLSWGGWGGGNCLSLVNLKIFAFQRAHCLLTVRRCSSVGKLLSWLDSNGKHKVRLVPKHRMGFFFFFFFF